MRKLLAVLLVFVTLTASGCTAGKPLPGEELILAAREWYTSLDSARVDVVNDATGESEQTFIFKYDEKGLMTYSYVGVGEGIYLEQYNNGREQFTNDGGEITALDASSLQFTAYSREVPYPMADEGLILFYKRAVIADESYIEEHGGAAEVRHSYDVSKLGQYDGEGELVSFCVTYRFDENGSLISFTESTELLNGGSTEQHDYTIYITECNEVKKVENVVDISSISD